MITLVLISALAAPDRSAPPPVIPPSPLELPEPTVQVLRPGLSVHHVAIPGARKVGVRVHFGLGAIELAQRHSPLIDAYNALIDVATLDLDEDALALATDELDLSLWATLDLHDAVFSLDAPVDALDDALPLLAGILHTPAFTGSELRRFKVETRYNLLNELPTSPSGLINTVVEYLRYPASHPYSEVPDLKAVRRVSRRDLRSLHASLIRSAPLKVLVTGDLSAERAAELALRVARDAGVPAERPPAIPAPPIASFRAVGVHLPAQQQAGLYVQTGAPPYTADDAVPFAAVNYALGGAFLSRLNRNLREDKGFTYGIRSMWVPTEVDGTWVASTDVAAANAGAAISEMLAEIAIIARGGPTEDEIDAGYLDAVSGWNETLRTGPGAASAYLRQLRRDESAAEARARLLDWQSLDPAAAATAARAWLGEPQHQLWTLLGDRAVLEPQLRALGWDVTWIEAAPAALGELEEP